MAYATVDEILDFAISNEEAAYKFYLMLAETTKREGVKTAFLDFAKEEQGHKEKLLKIKAGNQLVSAQSKVVDLKIGDHLKEIDLTGELDYQAALVVAMKAEKAAFRLYTELASATDDPGLKELLLGLAQEEAKHKLRFEIEYDDFMYEN